MKKIIVLIALIGIFVGGCDKKKLEKKSYTIGIDANSRYPFEYKDECSGEIKGFEPELICEIAKRGNFKINFVETVFLSIIPGVKEGNLDMGVGFISMTDERKKMVDFSESYYTSRVIVLGNKENLNIDKKKLIYGFPKGTYFKNFVKDINTIDIVEDIEIEGVMEKLIAKEIDYTIVDSGIGTRYIIEKPMIYEKRTLRNDPIAIVFSKGLSENFKKKVNSIIVQMKNDGTLDTLKEKYHVVE